MEGVVVSARRDGATFTVSVVSDAQGRYRFPHTHLTPGTYALTIRAVGYDLVAADPVAVTAGATATRDLTLQTTTDLASQLSSLEWLMSMPGTPEQKGKLVHQLLSCAYCHTYERIMKSRHNAEEMVPVITRMSTFFQDGTAVGRGGRGRAVRNENTEFAGQSTTWGFSPPRSQDRAGRVPGECQPERRPDDLALRAQDTTTPDRTSNARHHDAVRHAATGHGTARCRGRFDRRPVVRRPEPHIYRPVGPDDGCDHGTPLPELPAGRVGGISDVHFDLDGRLWFPMTSPTGRSHFGSPAMFDPKTAELTKLDYPDDQAVQFLARGPDGKIWMNSVATVIRIDPQTMEVEATFNLNNAENPAPGPHAFYQLGVNSKGDAYGTDWLGSYIVGIDGEIQARCASLRLRRAVRPPRRGKMDAQDRFWFRRIHGGPVGHVRYQHGNVPGVARARILDTLRRLDSRQERLRLRHEQHG